MLKVGIPRALLFYEYYPFWRVFFEELGAKVILSEKTTKSILDAGVKVCVDEACLPIKIFHGHVINLKGKVDYIFIPRLTSVAEQEYICPKFGGIPDMVKSSIKGMPKVISTEINLKNSYNKIYSSIKDIGNHFTRNTAKIMKAYKKAAQAYVNSRQQLKNGFPGWMTAGINQEKDFNCLNIGLLGHPYNIYDTYVNMELIKKLNANTINVITPEMMDDEEINKKALMLPKKIFWTFGRKIIGSLMCMIESKNIHGIVYIMSFGCGLDSFLCDMAERRIRSAGIPFTTLVLDEHTGEAGVDTRIEAFVDMIRWRDRIESHISTHG